MIDKAVIMALDKRKELWQPLAEQCKSMGWDVHAFVSGNGSDTSLQYNYIDPDPVNIPNSYIWGSGKQRLHHYLGYLSHKKILEYVMSKNFKYHLLLEDDAYLITDRFKDFGDKIFEEIDKLNMDWDLIYLGWHAFEYIDNMHAGRNVVIEERYKKSGKFLLKEIDHNCSGMHGVLVNSRHYEKMYNYPPIVPIDSQWNSDTSLVRYMVQPKMIGLHSTWSYCENSYVNRDQL